MKNISFEQVLLILIFITVTCEVIYWKTDYNNMRQENEKVLKSEQAMNKLRLEKEKFDYGIITLERYNQIRDSLAVYIK